MLLTMTKLKNNYYAAENKSEKFVGFVAADNYEEAVEFLKKYYPEYRITGCATLSGESNRPYKKTNRDNTDYGDYWRNRRRSFI